MGSMGTKSAMIQAVLSKLFFLVALVWLGSSLGAQGQAPRYAVVIGNNEYAGLPSLGNPVNDATDMAASLTRLGFTVDLLTNADLGQMEESVVRLGSRLASNPQSTGLFFFAGHGIQSNGANYLIPSRTTISAEPFLKSKALSAQSVLDIMQQSKNTLNLIFLDACRDNPFGWARSGTRGLSVVGQQPPGSIVVYATSAGAKAEDGTGRNGVFTGELLKNLETPGLDLNTILDRTAQGVLRATNNNQNPAIYKQYFDTTILRPSQTPSPSPNPVQVQNPVTPSVQPTTPQFGTITVATGAMNITLETPGIVKLFGQSVQVPGGGTLPVGQVPVGSHVIEVTYADGRVETKTVRVEANQTVQVPFTYRPGVVETEPVRPTPGPSNGQDRYEPDSQSQAQAISANGDLYQRFLGEDDTDWVRFTATGNGFFTLNTLGDLDTTITVYLANSTTELSSDDDGGDGLNAKVVVMGQRNQVYVAKITGYDGSSGDYSLSLSYQEARDDYEPNDTRAQAKTLRVGDTIQAAFARTGDEDWFKITAQGTAYPLVIYTEGSTDTTLKIYDRNGTLIVEDDDSGEAENAKVARVFPAGDLFIQVTAYSDAMGLYSLRTQQEQGGQGDAQEPDSQQRPVNLASSGASIRRTLHTYDEDWFRIEAGSTGMLTITTASSIDTTMELYGADGAKLSQDDDGGEGSNALIAYSVQRGQIYLARVTGYDGATGDYGISATIQAIQDSFEPNDTRAQARQIRVGDSPSAAFIRPGDEDWYKFTAPNGQLFSVWTTGNSDTTMTLVDANGNELATDDDSGDEGNAKLSHIGTGADVFVLVKEYDDASGLYGLGSSVTTIPPGDRYEPDNTMQNAKPITVGSQGQARTFNYAQDVDWAMLTISRAGRYRFQSIASARDGLDTYIEVTQANGTEVGSDDDGGDTYDTKLELELSVGTYYIKVRVIGELPSSGGAYTLSVTSF